MRGRLDSAHAVAAVCVAVALVMTVLVDTPTVARLRRDRGSRAGGEPGDRGRTGCRGGVATSR